MSTLERSVRVLKVAVYGLVALELLNVAIQTALLVAAEIATR